MVSPPPHVFSCLSLFIILLFISAPTSSAQPIKPSKVVDQVCKQVSNYTFCVDAIYSDSRAVTLGETAADLVEVTLSLAYYTMIDTSNTIKTLRNDPKIRKDKQLIKALLHCRANYRRVDKDLEGAFDLKNSEVYSTLKLTAARVSSDASDCENGFKKIGKPSPLTQGNKRLVDISAINTVVANILNS